MDPHRGGLPAVLAYREPMRRWWLAVPALLAFAFLMAAVLAPVSDAILNYLTDVLPTWLLLDGDTGTEVSRSLLIFTTLVTLVIDGLINPTVEELYFPGYLLPRLLVTGWRAVPVSSCCRSS